MTPMETAIGLAEIRGWQVERLYPAEVWEVGSEARRPLADTYVVSRCIDFGRGVESTIIVDTDLGLRNLLWLLGNEVQTS